MLISLLHNLPKRVDVVPKPSEGNSFGWLKAVEAARNLSSVQSSNSNSKSETKVAHTRPHAQEHANDHIHACTNRRTYTTRSDIDFPLKTVKKFSRPKTYTSDEISSLDVQMTLKIKLLSLTTVPYNSTTWAVGDVVSYIPKIFLISKSNVTARLPGTRNGPIPQLPTSRTEPEPKRAHGYTSRRANPTQLIKLHDFETQQFIFAVRLTRPRSAPGPFCFPSRAP
ncbi:hypothetical protein EVAR_24293_1 [Eumeta japonica]|uniref:Uncharacterized protein n=1 Tax=Eumeta variegata TaxID=151549 RepID=A0A4C1VE64_EUMVA|nr:hypothetical protein EVAR_24293_1 [Eumeta japonica]